MSQPTVEPDPQASPGSQAQTAMPIEPSAAGTAGSASNVATAGGAGGIIDQVGRWAAAFVERPGIRWVWRAIQDIGRNNVTGLASQLAYSFLFSLFPFLLCLVALASFLPVHGLTDTLLFEIKPFVPRSGFDLIAQTLRSIVAQKHGGLVSLGFLLALWSTSNAVMGLMTGLNQVYGIYNDHRSFFVTRGIALGVTVGVSLFGLLAVVVVVGGGGAGRWVSRLLGHPNLYSQTWSVVRWPAAAALMLLSMGVIYLILPNVRLRIRDVIPGAIVAGGLWMLTTLAFSIYLSYSPDFGAAYGSLGTAVVVLTWLYLNGLVLIVGGQINALVGEARGVLPPPKRE